MGALEILYKLPCAEEQYYVFCSPRLAVA